jgi:MFS family permease
VQEVLGLSAASFGALLTAGALGGVIGSVAASRVSRRIGPGASLYASLLGGGVALAVTGLTSAAAVVWVAFVVFSFLAVLWNVITVSLRQSIIPDRLLGRVNSVYRFLAWGMMPVGALLGGVVVTVSEPLGGRELALRMPFLLAAAAYFALFVVALPRLSTRRIEEARAAA